MTSFGRTFINGICLGCAGPGAFFRVGETAQLLLIDRLAGGYSREFLEKRLCDAERTHLGANMPWAAEIAQKGPVHLRRKTDRCER